jgi:hypothetical protein
MDTLATGTYYVVFQMEDEIIVVPFDYVQPLILSVSAAPNPSDGSGSVNISYTLSYLPSHSLKISIVNSTTGTELIEAYNDIPTSLSDNFNTNVTGLAAGHYVIIFQTATESVSVPFEVISIPFIKE